MFFSNAKRSHEEVVKSVGRYLKRDKVKFIIYFFNDTKPIKAHFDADFSRKWNSREKELFASASSRHGHIIKTSNFPVY